MREQIDSYVRPPDVTGKDTAPTTGSAESHSLSHFLRLLFRLLDEHEIRYCVLHSWQGLPDELASDLDLAVHPSDRGKLPSAFRALQDNGYQLVQCLNYFVKAYYFVFFWFEDHGLRSAAVDIIFEHRRSGLISLSGEELISGRERFKDFWVASPTTEFTYLLAKRTWKGYASSHQVHRLRHLVEHLGQPQAEKLAGKIFLGKLKARVVDACANGSIDKLLRKIGAQPWRTSLARHPLGLVRFLFGEALRGTRRWLQPTGLFVVILGPDGVGKSTLVGRLSQAFDPCFRRCRIFHWRPMVIAAQRETGITSTNPHDQAPRGTLGSVAALLVVLLDYWVGYLTVLRPFLARSGLIVFDRYFQDLLVDPIRYRYGGPMWLPRLLSAFVPPPDLLLLVLDADEEVILSRKRDLSPEELRRQRASYHQLTGVGGRATLIKADQGVEKTCLEASRPIVDYLTERFQRQHARWLASGS
jgi:thymidylate kinase